MTTTATATNALALALQAAASLTPDTCPKMQRPKKCQTAPKNLRDWPFVFASQPLWVTFDPSKVRCWLKSARRMACGSSAWQGLHDLECALGWVKMCWCGRRLRYCAQHLRPKAQKCPDKSPTQQRSRPQPLKEN